MTSAPIRAVVAVALLVATACGGDDGEPAIDLDETSTTAETTTTDTSSDDEEVSPPTSRGLPEPVTVEPIPGEIGSRNVLAGEPPYRGWLGQLHPDRMVVQPVALPPAEVGEGIAPLTGLPLDDPADGARPAIIVKIDNTEKGRPQESLSQADLVYEEQIEGGFTRLAAVYHTSAPLLGPVRSGRTTDIALLGSLRRPIFAWSGANLVHAALLREHDFVDLGAQTRLEYSRDRERPGTYNLMTEAATLHEIAARRGEDSPPPAHFEYRDDTIGLPPSAEQATELTVTYRSATASWAWDDDGWARSHGDEPHVDADDVPIVATNVVVAEVPLVATGSIDTSGTAVNEQVFLGSGRGWIFTDGHVVEVTWTKPSIRSVATWTTEDGVPVALVPGVTWIQLIPAGGLSFS